MTDDQIKGLAEEVGFVAYGEDAGEYRIPTPAMLDRLGRFAKACIAHGLEMGADECDTAYSKYLLIDMAAEMRK